MESLINFQGDITSRISKARINFKKSPKERIIKEYVENRLEALDQLWFEFLSGHKELMRSANPKELNSSSYISNDVYDKTEDIYISYKTELKLALKNFNESATNVNSYCEKSMSNVKYPKINIPNFSGNYSEWTTFKQMFTSLIINNSSFDDVQKLHYLKSYLVGDAEQLLRHVPIDNGNFTRSWQLLQERYNNKKYICHQTLKRLLSQKNLQVESADGLRDLVDTTNTCLATLQSLGIDTESWDVLLIHILTLKLDPETRRQWEFHVTKTISSEELPTYKQFTEFLSETFRAVECLDPKSTKTQSNSSKMKALHVTNTNVSCPLCSDDHKLYNCKQFHKSKVDDRRKFVYDNNICFNCMGGSHSAKECHSNSRCRICKQKHHSLLHPGGKNTANNVGDNMPNKSVVASSNDPTTSNNSASLVSCFSTGKIFQQVLLATAVVKVTARNGEDYKLRALLDQGSQSSFITESAVQFLGLKKRPTTNHIAGLGGGKDVVSKAAVDLTLKSLYDPTVKIPVSAHVIKCITSPLPAEKVEPMEWLELKKLSLADPEYHTPNRIDILLGAEVYTKILRAGIKRGPLGTPLAQATCLGWILSGEIESNTKPTCNINVMHCRCTSDLKRFWELESDIQLPKEKLFTDEEKFCEQHFETNTRRESDGRYIVRLPLKVEVPQVTSSRDIAVNRLKSLERQLHKNKTLRVKYQEVIDEYLKLNHMELISTEEINNPKAIYLPHHAVVRNDKETTKVRIVFDASCKGKNNMSLNDQLAIGPTLQPELRHIIMRWRSPSICMSADIVKMYRQVKTDNRDNDFQRILWRENPKLEMKHYKLTRVTFGTASAPYLAVKALQQVAHDDGADYPMAAERTLKDFYVDDFLSGCESVKQGYEIFTQMNELLGKAKFKLQKWNSNSNELLELMKGKEKDKEKGKESEIEEELRIKEDELIKIMGLTWNRRDDTFRYSVNLPTLQQPVTKRMIISDISRLYDPLGWVGPSLIIAKIMIQKLWLAGLTWDEIVPNDLLNEWLTYREEQLKLREIRIPRWIGTHTDDHEVEIHGFCDASKSAYAAVVYVRVIDSERNINLSLITAKTKVAPVKQVSIPRLELCGAVLLSKLLMEVATVFNIEKRNIHAWTDSTVVLAWLNNHPSKWSVFVANRVSEIHTNLDPQNWSHVTSKQNPADCASRGLHPSELLNSKLWFSGPEFLYHKNITYNKPKITVTDLEALKIKTNCAIVEHKADIWDKYSSLTKMTRIIAYCKRFINNCKNKNKNNVKYITAKELKEALHFCITKDQTNHFAEELKLISQKRDLPKGNKLRSLNPFIDPDNILRVGGRLGLSDLGYNRKHPILMPKQSHLTQLIIADAHNQTLHGGPQLTLNYIQTKYWIIGAKQLVKSHYRKCVTCVKNAAVTKAPFMGQVPTVRTTPTRAFKHSGVDYAGPIQLRTTKGRGHKSYKGYIALFICMATKAIHLEVVSDLTTEGFLQAFKRFVARRGGCSHLWSDNATNFIGASGELKKCAISERKQMLSEVAASLATNDCEWHFIPAHSPNFGGLWEAGVKSVKHHLKRTIGNSTLTYEEMATVLSQIEACLNSRPLSVITSQSEIGNILTPGHFLIGEPLITAPDHDVGSLNVSSLRRWQYTQRMLQSFWQQWSNEYLNKFLLRYKWNKNNPQPKLDDVVVVKEDGLPPSRWLFGRVIATYPGADNIVRVVDLKTKGGVIKRPTQKLCILPVAE